MKLVARTEGFKELSGAMKALPERMNKRVIRGAVRKGAVVIQQAAIEKAPEGAPPFSPGHKTYGSLKENIKISAFKVEKDRALFQVYPGQAFWSRWVEFGRLGERAQPFLRPALDENSDRAITVIIKAIVDGLAREAKKLVSDYGTARKALLSKSERL